MKSKSLIVKFSGIALLIILVVSACTTAPMDIKKDIDKVNQSFMTAITNQDVDALMDHYTSDIIILPAHKAEVKGTEAVRKMWEDSFKYGMGELKVSTTEAIAHGNTATEHGIYEYYTKGNQLVDNGKYVVYWKKVNNQWKMAWDIWNSSNPMPPRASKKDTISMAITWVKPDKVEAMKDFAFDIFLPAFEEHYGDSRAASRLFSIVKGKGYDAQFIYFIDPYQSHQMHDVKTILYKHYNEMEATKYLKEFRSYITKQDIIYATPLW